MSNYFDMQCPRCGGTSQIDILAEVWLRVCVDGTDANASRCGDHHFTPESTACCGCGHWATVADFDSAIAKAKGGAS
jgi:ribosomal protein L37E